MGIDIRWGGKNEKRKVFSLALKDERVEQCGSEFQKWGPKQEKDESHKFCVCICVRDGVYRLVAVEKGKQDQNQT